LIMSTRTRSILQGLLVAFLWSTSWILVKSFLEDFPPLLLTGMRYFFAALILLPGVIKEKRAIQTLSRKNWLRLGVLGLAFYSITQGSIYAALAYLDATSLSLLLNFTTIFVAVFSVMALQEIPTRKNWFGIGLFLVGVVLYFYPVSDFNGQFLGVILAGIAVAANTISGLLGRVVNRESILPAPAVTGISMGMGSVVLLSVGLAAEPLPHFSLKYVAVLAWLVLVNTAFAFSLWNRTLQHLTAVESSIINNTILVQTAVLAWIFLGEQPSPIEWVGLAFASLGILLANLKPNGKRRERRSVKTDPSNSQ